MRSSFWCSSKCSGASLQCCWVCGFHFCVCNWKTLPWAWEKHQCCYRNGLQALPIQPAELSYAKPISEVRVRPVSSPSRPLDTGLCSGEGEAAASSVAHKTCLQWPRGRACWGLGLQGAEATLGCTPGATPAGPEGPSVQRPPPGFFSFTAPYPALLCLLDLLFFPKDRKNPCPSGFSLPLFPF